MTHSGPRQVGLAVLHNAARFASLSCWRGKWAFSKAMCCIESALEEFCYAVWRVGRVDHDGQPACAMIFNRRRQVFGRAQTMTEDGNIGNDGTVDGLGQRAVMTLESWVFHLLVLAIKAAGHVAAMSSN